MQFVLTFHGIGPPERPLDHGEARYWLTQGRFEALLDKALAWSGCRELVVTFDDGNRSDLTIALPALLKRGLIGHFFVLSGKLGRQGYLRKSEVRALANAGMRIGSHGAEHVDWRRVPDEVLDNELVGARDAIAEAIGQTIDEVAIPFGSYDRRVIRRLRQAGYRAVFSSDGGPADDRAWFRPRTTARADTPPAALDGLLSRNWSCAVRSMQRARIMLKQFR